MKRLLATLILAMATIAPASAQPQTAAPAASAPVPAKRINPLPQPEAPAVQRSKEATIPGDLRPERQTVPQLTLPFGGKGSYRGPATGGIDDSVARCRAKRTSAEREACEAGLDNI
jgi:hypothetical protein